MDCFEATKWSRYLGLRLVNEKISLDAASFYSGILTFKHEYLPWLLDFQVRAWEDAGVISGIANALHRWIDRRLKSDFGRFKRTYRGTSEST